MKIDNEEMIINFGALGYDVNKMSIILGVSKMEIERELSDIDSEFSKLLEKGKHISDYVIDLKLFNLAKNGDLAALKKFEERKKQRQLNEKRSNYLNQK